MFGRILVPFIVCVSPEFIFYPAFSLIPKGIGYDNIRYISIALYDVWLAMSVHILLLSTYSKSDSIMQNVHSHSGTRSFVRH